MQPPSAPAAPAGPPRAAEFFAGIGLVRLAIEQDGWTVVFANDIDPRKREMYDRNFGAEHFHLGDIHHLAPADLPDCDLFTASFPCNDLSIAGARSGLNGKESSAFWGLVNLLEAMENRRPPLVLLENVVGFLQSHGGRDFEAALLALNRLGYTVDAFILNALHWTAQSRARLFVVAHLAPMRECGDSESSATDRRNGFLWESDVRPQALCAFIAAHPNVRWDIRQLPPLPRQDHRLDAVLEDLPDNDPHWWDQQRADYLFSQLSDRHLAAAREMMKSQAVQYATVFRRVRHGRSMAELRTDGLAGCLRTPRGGSGRQILFKAGNDAFQVRLLTARECARLQGVPDSYVIDVPLNQALFGFGDAVCVPAVAWIARHYLTPLARSPAIADL